MVGLDDIFANDEETQEKARVVAESANPARDFIDDLVYWLEKEKTEPPRSPGLHCSSLWKVCAREALLSVQHAEHISVTPLTAGHRMTFDEGHAIHDLIQNIYCGPWGRMWGEWKCLKCQDIVFSGTMPSSCPRCDLPWRDEKDGSQNIIYSEPFVRDSKLGYCGHCDGIILNRDGSKKRVFEFKTISPSQYKSLRRAKSAHVIQVHAYMNGLGLDEALVVYWDKGSQCDWTRESDGTFHAANPHLKAFNIKFDHELWAGMVSRILDYNKAATQAKELPTISGKDVMKFKRICTHARCDLAAECAVSYFCFKLPK